MRALRIENYLRCSFVAISPHVWREHADVAPPQMLFGAVTKRSDSGALLVMQRQQWKQLCLIRPLGPPAPTVLNSSLAPDVSAIDATPGAAVDPLVLLAALQARVTRAPLLPSRLRPARGETKAQDFRGPHMRYRAAPLNRGRL
jgi:hypothetical protein